MYEYKSKMSLNDIHEVTMDISNSLYRLRKNGNLDHLSEDEFKEIYKLASKLDSQITWATRFQNIPERETK